MAQVLDYSSRPPSGAAVRSAGYLGVVRYAGTPGRAKNITRAEFEDMDMSGVGVALVYENQAGDALNGFGAGQASARAILADATNIGFPSSRPLYFACDRDIVTEQQFTAVMSYLDGAASVLGAQRVGVYGEHDVVKRALEGGHARYGWQTVAWSGGKHYEGAHLYQLAGYVYPGGVQCDASNVLRPDWGQHNTQGGGWLMALTDAQQQDLYQKVIDISTVLGGYYKLRNINQPGTTEDHNIGTAVYDIESVLSDAYAATKGVEGGQGMSIGAQVAALYNRPAGTVTVDDKAISAISAQVAQGLATKGVTGATPAQVDSLIRAAFSRAAQAQTA